MGEHGGPTSESLSMRQTSFFLESTPLLDANWTGISVVCANVARQLVRRGLQLEFCMEESVLPREAMLEALDGSSGLYVARDLAVGRVHTRPLVPPRDRVSVGLSASVKRFNRLFDVESSWIHDISTLLQPEFHTADNIAWHAERVIEDIESNDLSICVSQATLDDLVAYFGLDPAKLLLAYNGVEWPWWYAVKGNNERQKTTEAYLVVLGTREPRKNLELVFDMLTEFPEVLATYRVLLAGQEGWLTEEAAMPPHLISAVSAGRLQTTGFVSDYEKYQLLAGAEASIFPSVFEGFGLPVVESLSVGTPCIASFSSSLPEVGGALCEYFDPFSTLSLHDALQRTLALKLKQDRSFPAAAKNWAGRFSWDATMDSVLSALAPYIERARSYRRL